VAGDPDRAESALNRKIDENAPPPIEYYVVVSGDTLLDIALSLGVDAEKLASANQLGNIQSLSVGQRLIVPPRPNAERRAQVVSRGATLLPRFIWPAQGYITTHFGEAGAIWIGGHHTGLDIGAKEGDPILAAETGRVIEAGWSTGHGYGNYVMIDHGLGYRTLYGHMSVIRVKAGQQVSRGQQIGDVGNTGVSLGAHLHFEVQSEGVPVDPLGLLP
jgi:murein DD-endopeptidase MepM/ murein hydrolase activator NlpD